MKELEEKILSEAKVLSEDILKVGSFLNHQVDINLLEKMALEVKKFHDEKITKVLTIEASGLPFATALAMQYKVPMVFAKKSQTLNVDSETYSAKVHSYTHNKDNIIYVPKDYIKEDDIVLIADDFLAKGSALTGLIEIVNEAHAKVSCCAIQIEKSYQSGGDSLRNAGYRIISLARIIKMNEKEIIFKK